MVVWVDGRETREKVWGINLGIGSKKQTRHEVAVPREGGNVCAIDNNASGW
jgi:hypothetical protein